MKNKFLLLFLSIITFGYVNAENVRFNYGSDLEDIFNEIENDFDKMSFDKNTDEGRFNLRVVKALRTPAIAQGIIPKMIASGQIPVRGGVPNTGGADVAQGLIAQSKGDLNIIVTRNSTNIARSLPYVLFGANDFAASYISTLAGFIPSAVTLTSVTTTAAGNVRFTYTEGAAVDTIDVSFSGLSNYASFLRSMSTTYFKSRYILYSISDVTNLAQFFNLISFGDLTSLGAKGFNQLSPNSRKLPSDFQDDRVNLIFPEQAITPDFAFVQQFGQFAMSVNWDIFMSDKDVAWRK